METTSFSFANQQDVQELLTDERLQSPRHALAFQRSAFQHLITDSDVDNYLFLPLERLRGQGLCSLTTWFDYTPYRPTGSVQSADSRTLVKAVPLCATFTHKATDLHSVRQVRFIADGRPNNIELEAEHCYFKATTVQLSLCDGNGAEQTWTLDSMVEVHLNLASRQIECV